jgi:hypothetical protein
MAAANPAGPAPTMRTSKSMPSRAALASAASAISISQVVGAEQPAKLRPFPEQAQSWLKMPSASGNRAKDRKMLVIFLTLETTLETWTSGQARPRK